MAAVTGKMEMDTLKQYNNINTLQDMVGSLYTQIGTLDEAIKKFCGNSASGPDIVLATKNYEICREEGTENVSSISTVLQSFATFTHNVRVNYNDLVKITNGLL